MGKLAGSIEIYPLIDISFPMQNESKKFRQDRIKGATVALFLVRVKSESLKKKM